MKNYYGAIKNVNDNYLRQCFYWAFREGLQYPVYQIHCTDSIDKIKENKFVLVITGNENHNNLDHYYKDPRVVTIIKNYPHMINHSGKEGDQAYACIPDEKGVIRFIVEEEDNRTLNIPLGTCNDFIPYNLTQKQNLGGFIGQWTKFREEYAKKLDALYSKKHQKSPFKFAFYKGFGPFVQDNESLTTVDYSYYLSNFEISFCFSGQSPETYRLLESAASGCAIVSTILPDVWYYKNLPALYITPDNEIGDIVNQLLTEKSIRHNHQRAVSEWYVETVSPPVIGKKIIKHLENLGY